jgi:predicted Na+-dependent transporter
MVKPLIVVTNVLLFVLFLGLAATVDVREFRGKFKAPRAIIAGMCCQFGIVPALGYLSTQLFELDAVLGVTLLILCSSPGGTYSNWWCSIGNADLALSVAMTTVSTLVSMIMLPVNTLIYIQMAYGSEVPLDWLSLMTTLVIAICAIGSGLYCGAKWPEKKGLFNAIGQVSGVAMIAISTIFSSRTDPIWNRDRTFYMATALPCIGALLVSSLFALILNFKKTESVAVVIETAYQNVGLATSIAVGTFDDDETASIALGVPLFYGVLEAVLIALWCLAAHYLGWSYAPPGTSLWKAVVGNFQPVSADSAVDGIELDPIDDLDLTALTKGQTRERTSSVASGTASSPPPQPYSPPAVRSPQPLVFTSAAKQPATEAYTPKTPSDPGSTPPTTPTKGPADAQTTRPELFVAVAGPNQDTRRAESPNATPQGASADVPELGSPHTDIRASTPLPLSKQRAVELPSPRSA